MRRPQTAAPREALTKRTTLCWALLSPGVEGFAVEPCACRLSGSSPLPDCRIGCCQLAAVSRRSDDGHEAWQHDLGLGHRPLNCESSLT